MWWWIKENADALGAMATVAAVFVTVWFAMRESGRRKKAELERDTERAKREDRDRRAQAEHVAGWLEHTGNWRKGNFELVLANYSSAPVFDVVATMEAPSLTALGAPTWELREATLPPGNPTGVPTDGFLTRVTAWAGDDVARNAAIGALDDVRPRPSAYRVTLTFVDLAGTAWKRSGAVLDEAPWSPDQPPSV